MGCLWLMVSCSGRKNAGNSSTGYVRVSRMIVTLLVLELCIARAVVSYQIMPDQSGRQSTARGVEAATSSDSLHTGRHDNTKHSPDNRGNHHSGSNEMHPNSDGDSQGGVSLPPPRRTQHTSDTAPHGARYSNDCPLSGRPHHVGNRTKLRTVEEVHSLPCQYYGPWSKWRRCNRRCHQTRVRRCRVAEQCGTTNLKERRTCRRQRGRCAATAVYRQAVGKFRGNNRLIERVLYDNLYADWSPWSSCTRSCKQRRRRKCTVRDVCQNNFIQETRRCSVPGSRCEKRHKLTDSEGVKDPQKAGKIPSSDTNSPESSTGKPESVPMKGKTKPRSHRTKGNKGNNKQNQQDREDAGDVLSSAQRTCGRRPPATRGSYRVVGGQEAQRLSWPWQVAILTRWEEQYCAGTLIAPQWVLTAAHCVRKKGRRRRIIVRAGEHDLQEFEGSQHDIKPEREYPHPDFDYVSITNDIALIRLKEPVEERSLTGYACLPDPSFTPDRDSLCYILGWGKRRNTHLFGADLLHEAQVPLVSPKRCQKVFDYHIDQTQVCAGYRRGGTDACAGDSGGPLLCPKTEEGVTRWFLTGITSYGEGCGRRGKYGIYTRVTSYRDWIADVMRSY